MPYWKDSQRKTIEQILREPGAREKYIEKPEKSNAGKPAEKPQKTAGKPAVEPISAGKPAGGEVGKERKNLSNYVSLMKTGSIALPEIIFDVESILIEEILKIAEGNQIKASQILGIGRATLQSKLKKYGIGN